MTSDFTITDSPQIHRDCERLPSHEREGQIFWKLRWREGRAHLAYLFTQARLRTSLIVGLSALFWLGLFVLFCSGFEFVMWTVGSPGATYHAQTVGFVFSLFFMSLQVMLIFSSGIILYGGLYSSRETDFLLTLPVRDSRTVFYRFQEAVFFSSWGFFLMASPMMIAYGWVVSAPWYYYAYLPGLVISFAYIPCALGAIICLIVVSHVPHLRLGIIGVGVLGVIIATYLSVWKSVGSGEAEMLNPTWFVETFRRFEFMRGEWLPSTWLSNSLLDSARPNMHDPNDLPWFESGRYLVVLVSNALLLHVGVAWVGKKLFRKSYCELNTRQARKARPRMTWVDFLADRMLFVLSRETRLLIIKDFRLFRRDPVQWSQFLIFFGLLLLYFVNVDRFRQHQSDMSGQAWINLVSFLNLAVVGLILSTFTTRFIYPLISLEGRRFWILGRLPVDRGTILWGKFLFAAGGSWLPCAGLVFLSDLMLNVSGMVISVHQATCVMLCVGLAGMSVGLGALMPNFREQSPSKIAAGFGGTLNLVLSALYILAVVSLTALPCHFFLLSDSTYIPSKYLRPGFLYMLLGTGLAAAFALAAIATIVPMRRGLRAFRQLEV